MVVLTLECPMQFLDCSDVRSSHETGPQQAVNDQWIPGGELLFYDGLLVLK